MTTTASITINPTTYVALSTSETDCVVAVQRGQSVRIHLGASAPAADTANFVPFDNPPVGENAVKLMDLREFGIGRGEEAYALLVEGER